MVEAVSPESKWATVADLLHALGNISPQRILMSPAPGTAAEQDVLRIREQDGRLCELIDGVLVEKIMGYPESSLTCELIRLLGNFLHIHKLGKLAGPDGALRLMPKLIRIPDISFISWDRVPDRQVLQKPIPDVGPDLAI
jgi:Uma2 family endonuclease